jgi:hypothetical protein
VSLRPSNPSRFGLRVFTCFSLGILWVVGIAVGMPILINYEYRPAPAATAPEIWPKDSGIERVRSLPTLVLFGHPQCPCTRATIGELALLMTRLNGQLTANVIFIKPTDTREKWEQTDLWRTASSIPGAKVMSDPIRPPEM